MRQVGTVKAISGNRITLTSDAGADLNVIVSDSTRIVRAEPGQKDLSAAAPIAVSAVQAGDRVLIRGKATGQGSVTAGFIVVMKSSDIARKQEQEREDWQKRGIGGLVRTVDPANGTVTISTSALATARTVIVRVAKTSIIRRYAADSVKFDDATVSTLDQIKPGDQLRARGTRSADGAEFAAEEIVSGAFRNVAGTVISTDAAAGTIKVMDLETKKPTVVKITADSQLHKLPPMVAQRIAMRLKGFPGQPPHAPPAPATAEANAAGPNGVHHNGAPDVQQMLNMMPAVSLADLHKEDAVMMVTTVGSANVDPVAVTLLTGVEPILTASPTGNRAAMLLSPWNLSGGGEGDAQ